MNGPSNIYIRDARPADADSVARLFMMAWPVEDFIAMSPSMTESSLHEAVAAFVRDEDTLYSYRNTAVAVCGKDGEEIVVGAMNGYDGAEYIRLRNAVAERLEARFPGAGQRFLTVEETEAGEFYLDSAAVSPEMRSSGIGAKLFSYMLKRASEAGFKKAGLIVDVDKPKAEALYKRLGFAVVGYKDFMSHKMKHMQICL